jgi:hypothetical protein
MACVSTPGLSGSAVSRAEIRSPRTGLRLAAAILALAQSAVIRAEPPDRAPGSPAGSPSVGAGPSYADIADLADSSPLVLRVQVRRQTVLEPERSIGVPAGFARVYLEALPEDALAGAVPTVAVADGWTGKAKARPQPLQYLADVPLDARGKPVSLRKKDMLAFARTVPGRADQIQLVAPDAQLAWTPELEGRVRAVLAELRAPDAPGRVRAVRDAMYVPGTLAGAGETQITLATAAGPTVSLSITHQPGQAPVWAVAFGEVFDVSGRPPARDTLAWYRLACFLPRTLPPESNLSGSPADRAQAAADYRLAIDGLGPCPRTLR